MKLVDNIKKSLRTATFHNSDVQAAPVCVLWPDYEKQWETVISRLQQEMPEIFILGDYNSEKRTGPAIWLRCIVAGKIENIGIPEGSTPIIYLPGISRQDLRVVGSTPEILKPLVELQYRGAIWSQPNAKDWTLLSFLKSKKDGLGLDVAQDDDSKKAMKMALGHLLDVEVATLEGKRLDKAFFYDLLTGNDADRNILQWLDNGEEFKASREEDEWKGFIDLCKSQYSFNPEADGPLAGAEKLAVHEGPWKATWERFCEAPKRYPNIPVLLRRTPVPMDLLSDKGGWPQWNDGEEDELRAGLIKIKNLLSQEGREQISRLEEKHGARRDLPWAELDESPLACALEHLMVLAEETKKSLNAGTIQEVSGYFQDKGWLADDAVVNALRPISKPEDSEAVFAAIRSIYLPWLESSSRYLQESVMRYGYPRKAHGKIADELEEDSLCIVFIDGLRFDVAKKLVEFLTERECTIVQEPSWAALPSLTATGKPSVMPLASLITGSKPSADFEPSIKETGQQLKSGYQFKKLLADTGWKVLEKGDSGDGSGKAWCEAGNIDHEGHDRGWKIAKHIELALGEIAQRIIELLDSGWNRVVVVTDHGWLLMPGGLPSIELPAVLTENKWGRCAIMKEGALCDEQLYPWFWNPGFHMALADGISCYRKGLEYAHGGLSLQECMNLKLTVSKAAKIRGATSLRITDVSWKGMRCTAAIDGDTEGLSIDIRLQPGDQESSLIPSPKPLGGSGAASVIVENEDMEGKAAYLVILSSEGGFISQKDIRIGGGEE